MGTDIICRNHGVVAKIFTATDSRKALRIALEHNKKFHPRRVYKQQMEERDE